MTNLITMPMLNVNDGEVLLCEWIKPDKASVRKAEIIAVIETSKATVDLEAECGGYLHIFVPAGTMVVIGEVIGALCDAPDEVPEKPTDRKEPANHSSFERKVTKKAELAAAKAGLSLARLQIEIPGTGSITEADVASYLGPSSVDRPDGTSEGKDLMDNAYPGNRQQRLLIVGGGFGAAQVLDSLTRIEHQRAAAIVDDNPSLAGKAMLDVPILGGQEAIEGLFKKGLFDAAVVSVSTSIAFRQRMGERLSKLNIPMANVIDPNARVQRNAVLGTGNVILAYCQIGSCARMGNGNFLSPYVDVEHHCIVGDYCTFGPGVMMSSLVRIGSRVKFGTGIFIEPKLNIGPDSIIGSGAIITRDIPTNSVVKTKANYTLRPRT